MSPRLGIGAAAAWRVWLLCALLGVWAPGHAYHYPWDQGHDTTTAVDPPQPGPEDRSCADPDISCSATRSPVYAANGQAIWRAVDVALFGRPYIGLYRVYNSNDPVIGPFGNGWAVDFDVALYPALAGGTAERIFKAANGKRFVYVRQADGSFRTPPGRFDTITETAGVATMVHPDGQRHVFAADGRLLQRIDTNGNAIAFSYDTAMRLTGIGDGRGRTLGLGYNAQGLISAVADHSGRTWRYAYDAQGSLVSLTDPAGGVTRYTWQAYKPAGDAQTYYQLLSAADASGVVQVSYTYSGNQVTSYTEGADRFSYTRSYGNTAGSGSVTRRDSLGATTTFDYGSLGLVTRDVDALGGATRYTYDANGRLSQLTDALGQVWTSAYDARGRMTGVTNPLAQATTLEYSGANPNPVRVTSPGARVTTMTYDALGNLLTMVEPSGAVTRHSYDARGNPTTIVDPLSQQTSIEFNAIGLPLRVTDALGRQGTLAYDVLGRMTASTNGAGETTTYAYDALDRTVAIVDALGRTTAMAYDAAGRLTSVTDAKGSVTRYEYDSHGRRTAEVAPDGRRTTFAYRTDNLLNQVTWPDNTRINYEYDANKRRTRDTAGSEVITYTYNALDQLTAANGPGGNVAYTYDDAGRVLTESSGGRTHTWTRNADGERIGLETLGQTLAYTRDVRGLVTRITAAAGNFDFSYDAAGRRTQLSYPTGATARATYDAAGQLVALAHAGPFAAAFAQSYDAASRITRVTGDGADWNYSYDALGRLTRASQGASATNYTLDAVGNLLDGGRTYDASHRMTGDTAKTYTYDQRGNLTLERDRTSGARVAYTWNVRNQLTRLEFFANGTTTTASRTLQYTYDAVGRRSSRTDAGVVQRFVYDGDDLIGTLDGNGNILAVNLFSGAIDEPLASSAAGVHRMLHANHLGSIVGVTQGNSLTHGYRYGPYGETLAGSSADSAPFRYTGREKDTDSLYYYRARYYSTAMQRFVSADPIGLQGGLNPYAYADGDPIGRVDPSGEQGLLGFALGAGGELIWQVAIQGKGLSEIEWRHVAAQGALGTVLAGPLVSAGKAAGRGYMAAKAWLSLRGNALIIKLIGQGAVSGSEATILTTCKLVVKGATNAVHSAGSAAYDKFSNWMWPASTQGSPAPAQVPAATPTSGTWIPGGARPMHH